MRIIAQSGNWFVIETADNLGRVFDAERGRLFREMSLVAILARGGWQDFEADTSTP